MEKQNTSQKADAIQVDWIVLTVSAIGLVVVVAASIRAGEGGLISNLLDFVAFSQTNS